MHSLPAALLLHQNEGPLVRLRADLETIGVHTARVHTCGEASRILRESSPPECIFSDLTVADGDWTDVLTLAMKSPVPVALIVVSDVFDISLYIAAMEAGAFDFIVHPCAKDDLAYVVKRAGTDVAERRQRTTPRWEYATASHAQMT
jgi:DNA-binding NtrC family response regulator